MNLNFALELFHKIFKKNRYYQDSFKIEEIFRENIGAWK